MRLLIVTPFVSPGVGGAAVYTELLSNGLVDKGIAQKVVVVTESFPGEKKIQTYKDGRLIIHRIFPHRAAVARKEWQRFIKYVVQNVLFLRLPSLVRQYRITHVLVHASFHYHPNLMGIAVRVLKQGEKVKIICDVRDPKLVPKYFQRLYAYDSVICCSENVRRHFAIDKALRGKLVTIPIMVDVNRPSMETIERCKARFGLTGRRYLFNGSGVYLEKGINSSLALIDKLQEHGEKIILVVAGKRRNWGRFHEEAAKEGKLVYVGVLPHSDVLALAAGAELDINLSSVDSMPRHTLEAMAVGAKTLFPDNVPELVEACPEFAAAASDVYSLALQVMGLMKSGKRCRYDISLHSPDKVLMQYTRVLN